MLLNKVHYKLYAVMHKGNNILQTPLSLQILLQSFFKGGLGAMPEVDGMRFIPEDLHCEISPSDTECVSVAECKRQTASGACRYIGAVTVASRDEDT